MSMSEQQECGSADSTVVHLTEQTFDEAVATASGIWMVDFWAPWCRPCVALAPVLEEIARASRGGVTLAKVNVDEQPTLAARHGIRSIPTVLFMKDGKVADQVVGAVPKAQIEAKLAMLVGTGVAP
jgi:thioredoxin 1